jgi:hypothetical protein
MFALIQWSLVWRRALEDSKSGRTIICIFGKLSPRPSIARPSRAAQPAQVQRPDFSRRSGLLLARNASMRITDADAAARCLVEPGSRLNTPSGPRFPTLAYPALRILLLPICFQLGDGPPPPHSEAAVSH